MKKLTDILFYISLLFALVSYVSYEISESLLLSMVKIEVQEIQTESESGEYEERVRTEEYAHSNSPELKRFYLPKQKQYCFQLLFISFDYKPFVWIPPKHA